MSLSSIFSLTPSSPTSSPTSSSTSSPTSSSTSSPTSSSRSVSRFKCESNTLLDTYQNIINAINDLIESYNNCETNNDCKVDECNQKFKDIVQALKEKYKNPDFIINVNNSEIKSLLKDDFTFNETDSNVVVFEIFLKFLENHFLAQTKTIKLGSLIKLKAIIPNPDKKGGRRKSRKNKSRKNKSRKNRTKK